MTPHDASGISRSASEVEAQLVEATSKLLSLGTTLPMPKEKGGTMGMTRSLDILVLDDHIEVAESLGEILELEHHRVTLVHDGLSAVQAFREHDFDLGFFDIKMPGLNGVDSFLEIKKTKPWAKIIMMSGFADDQLISTAVDNGAAGLLRKPFEVEELLVKLADAANLCTTESTGSH